METATVKARATVVRVELVTVQRPARRVVWYAATKDVSAFVGRIEAAMTPTSEPLGNEIEIPADSVAEKALAELVPWWARWGMVRRIRRDQASGAVVRTRILPEECHLVDEATAAQAAAQKELEL